MMKRKNLRTLLAVALVAGAGVTVAGADDAKPSAEPKGQAQGGQRPGGGEFFAQMDKDGDGKITESEAGERWERMSRLDSNSDGGVDKQEMAAMAGRGPGGKPGAGGGGEFLSRMDKDGDGRITEAEAGDHWERMSRMDKNSDGAIDQEERAAMVAAFGGGRPGGAGGDRPGIGEFMSRLDTDSDGRITEAEAGERWERMSRMDKNSDGAIDREELAAMASAFGGRPGDAGGDRPGSGEFFDRLDKDGDGKLVKEEVPAEMWERLSNADANADGAVTRDELGSGRPGGAGPEGRSANTPTGEGKKPKRPEVEP